MTAPFSVGVCVLHRRFTLSSGPSAPPPGRVGGPVASRPLPNMLNFATQWPLFSPLFALRPSSSLCNRLWRHRPRRARSHTGKSGKGILAGVCVGWGVFHSPPSSGTCCNLGFLHFSAASLGSRSIPDCGECNGWIKGFVSPPCGPQPHHKLSPI